VPLATVRGITVNRSIADRTEALLAAAAADGVVLRGTGYRDPAAQIALRRAHCGPTYYDIYFKPPFECVPPTAIPGSSMHEQGLAIDFTWNGSSITTQDNPGFVWLAANAARFGFFNLPSEPWHWSTTGK
jgi:LAS superfamily LD-carboxypeptidase LdcB